MLQFFFKILFLSTLFVPGAIYGETLNFDSDWKFIKADPPHAEVESYDDHSWESVSVPHTFNDTDTFSHWSKSNHAGEVDQWSGRTWYRKSFLTGDGWKTKKLFIEFESVRQVAEVYLNGHFLGKSENGFIPFGFDLTPYLHSGSEPNVLAVMCDNRFGKESPYPWNDPHWHPAHGGIYRNVYLHVLNPLHFTLPLFSNILTTGIYDYGSDYETNSVVVNVEAQVANETTQDSPVTYRAEVKDISGRVVLSLVKEAVLKRGETTLLKLSGLLPNPHRWSPDYPYVYTIHNLLTDVASKSILLDERDTPLGFREAQWTLREGLFLNGNHVKLHGWGQKPTDEWAGLGAAMPDWMHAFTLKMMRDAGGNFVRWGHCAGGPAMLQASDELGIITEQPGVDGEHDTIGHAWEVRLEAFRDMLIYYRNHPSILIWEGGNQAVTEEHVRALTQLVQQFDPHGGRVYGHRRADAITERYSQVSIGTEGQISSRLPTIEGEYDREESPRRVWDDDSPPDYGYLAGSGQTYDLTSEQYALNQIGQYMNKIGMPSHIGGANWIFSDSTSGGRNTSEVTRASGEVDAVRLPKQAYDVCKVLFHSGPQIHIIGHWSYPPERDVVKDVYVAANGDQVELLLNGKSLGFGRKTDRYLFSFPRVTWQPGVLLAKSWENGVVVKTDTLTTCGPAVALKLTPLTSPVGFLASGSDIALVDVEAIDSNGRRCPTYQDRVDFKLSGPGTWRGGYNSGKLDSINHPWIDLEAGINRVAVKSTLQPGTIHLTAEAKGLKHATMDLSVLPVSPTQLPVLLSPPDLTQLIEPRVGPGPSLAANRPVPAQNQGHYVSQFAYTGPSSGARISPNAQNGEPAYSSGSSTLANLPEGLLGADHVQFPPEDNLYSAVDLVSLTVSTDSVLYVAHDNLLQSPKWLTDQFTVTGPSFRLESHSYCLFSLKVHAGETVTLGGNEDGVPLVPNAAMYLVFIAK